MAGLIQTLSQCNPFFIRCVKPNATKAPQELDLDMVRAQLRYSGMLETIRVRRAGYTGRVAFADFIQRYTIINPNSASIKVQNERCRLVLSQLPEVSQEEWQIGKTRVFMKSTVENALEQRRAEAIVGFVIRIQAYFRMHMAKKYRRDCKKLARTLERAYITSLQKKKARKFRQGLIRAQACKLHD